MAKIVVVTSGKGGVGKTTTSASFASGLALAGKKTAVIDFDVGLRNLDLIMGCERRVVYDLINVIHDEAKLNQALIKDKINDKLHVLAASQITHLGLRGLREQFADPLRHQFSRRAKPRLGEIGASRRRFEVHLERPSAVIAGRLDEARGRIDRAGGADGESRGRLYHAKRTIVRQHASRE